MSEEGGKRAGETVFTFYVGVLDRSGDGWEAQCSEADLRVTGATSPRVLAEEITEHFEGIAGQMGEVGDRARLQIILTGPDADAVLAETRSADREPADPDRAESGDEAEESGKDPQPANREGASRTEFRSARLDGLEDEVEDLKSRIDGLEDQIEDLESRIDDLEGALL